MECEECDPSCNSCSEYDVCLDCYDENEIVHPDGVCALPIEGCLQDPTTYRIEEGKFVCDQCDLLKHFYFEDGRCVECNEVLPNCETCSDTTICDQCIEGFLLNADFNECWTEQEFRTFYEDYITEDCIGESPEDFILAVDEDDEFPGQEFFYGCGECETGFWNEDLTCFDCLTIDSNCAECENGDVCSTCKEGFIHEYKYET